MDYVKGAQDLRKKTLALLSSAKESKELKDITKWIVDKLYRIAGAVNFLHKHQIIHFDIKPSNILIDINDKPILSDLGFAKKKTTEERRIVVGFTLFYAHPDLRFEYRHMSSKNRVRTKRAPKDFKYIWDIYAFGKSLLEILALIDQRFPDAVAYDYKFMYLHLLACRMLDGRNQSQRETERIREKQTQNGEELSAYKETWLELDDTNFEEITYPAFEEICRDFEKLLIGEHFLESIPELNAFYPKRVQSSEGIPAPFSERVRYIIEHPVFSRLSYVYQLGLLNFVYPTATHTRLEHSLGTFRNCCLYIQSLYNDPYNPLFRQLINERDIKCALLASLLHDLGQYPLAHEMGEIAKELKHEKFTLKFLNNSTKDKFGHTLQDIIENVDWGWGLKLEEVKEILKVEKGQETFIDKKSLKTKLLSSIIDGPIDVDKLDYLLRDSQNCYLRYGESIDFDGLIKDLTVIITKDDMGQTTFIVGTYEKGQSAAESLTFARYLLYQSLYWHHTARAVRAMLREAIKAALKKRREIIDKIDKTSEVNIKSASKKKRKGKYITFKDDLEELIGVAKEPRSVIVNDMLNLIEKWTDGEGKNIIEMIKHRNYYKRILTIHSSPLREEGKKDLLERFRDLYKRPDFQGKLQKKIKEKFENYVYATKYPKVSLLAQEKTDKTVEILSTPEKIICDCPEPIYGTSENLRFIPEPQRLQRNYLSRVTIGERVSEVWNQVYFKLMNISSKGRVFCHPDIRDTLMAAIGPDGIKECLESVIGEFEH